MVVTVNVPKPLAAVAVGVPARLVASPKVNCVVVKPPAVCANEPAATRTELAPFPKFNCNALLPPVVPVVK